MRYADRLCLSGKAIFLADLNYYNNLPTLDVSNSTALYDLRCYGNNLTALDVSKNTALKNLYCYYNGIRGEGMTTLVNSLPVIPEGEDKGKLYVCLNETPGGNGITAGQVNIATGKCWEVLINNGSGYGWEDYEGLPDGDVNADGSVDKMDVEDLTDYLLGNLPEADKWFFDADGNGVVDVADIVYVINIIKE